MENANKLLEGARCRKEKTVSGNKWLCVARVTGASVMSAKKGGVFVTSPFLHLPAMIRFNASCLSILCLALIAAVSAATTNNDQLVLSSPSSSLSDKWSWTDCGSYDDAVLVNSIKISPDPPKPGEGLTVTASGIVYSEITHGTNVTVLVKLGLIKLLSKQLDVCEEAANANAEIQCPVKEGEYTVTQSVELPSQIPQAKFTVHVEGVTAKGESLLCLDLNVDFRPSFAKLFG